MAIEILIFYCNKMGWRYYSEQTRIQWLKKNCLKNSGKKNFSILYKITSKTSISPKYLFNKPKLKNE